MSASIRHIQSKTPGISEAVEGLTVRVSPRQKVIFSLVEKGPCLLAFQKAAQETDSIFPVDDLRGNIPIHEATGQFQTFEFTDAYIIALNDGARGEFFLENFNEPGLDSVGSLAERLEDKDILEAIDDDGGESITFRIHQSAGIRSLRKRQSFARSRLNPLFKKRTINRFVLAGGQEAQGNLRLRAEEGPSHKAVSSVVQFKDGPGLRLMQLVNVALVNPQVPDANALYRFPVDDGGFG